MTEIKCVIDAEKTIKNAAKFEIVKKIAESYELDDIAKTKAIKVVCRDDDLDK